MKSIYDGIIGLAVGDALGVPVEFKTRTDIKEQPVTSMQGYGTHNQPAGTWSDDTSLTLALLDSLATLGEVDYRDIMRRFLGWLMDNKYTAAGCVFDVGNSTGKAIIKYRENISPLKCGAVSVLENGNGSLMRILPIAYYLYKNVNNNMDKQMKIVHNISSLTHRHPISLIGCGIYVNIAIKMIEGKLSVYDSIEQGAAEAFEYYSNLK